MAVKRNNLTKHLLSATTIIELLVASLIVYLCYILFLLVFIKLSKPQFGSLKLKYHYESTVIIDSLLQNQSFVSAMPLSDERVLNIDVYASESNTDLMIIHGYVLNKPDTILSIYRSFYSNEK